MPTIERRNLIFVPIVSIMNLTSCLLVVAVLGQLHFSFFLFLFLTKLVGKANVGDKSLTPKGMWSIRNRFWKTCMLIQIDIVWVSDQTQTHLLSVLYIRCNTDKLIGGLCNELQIYMTWISLNWNNTWLEQQCQTQILWTFSCVKYPYVKIALVSVKPKPAYNDSQASSKTCSRQRIQMMQWYSNYPIEKLKINLPKKFVNTWKCKQNQLPRSSTTKIFTKFQTWSKQVTN